MKKEEEEDKIEPCIEDDAFVRRNNMSGSFSEDGVQSSADTVSEG